VQLSRFLKILSLFVVVLFLGCAKQGYPPGGPVDKRGPVVIASFPNAEETGVSCDVRPWIQLDEYSNRSSVEPAIFISPEPEEGFEVKIKRKKITIIFNEDLQTDRTVVITFGTGISDNLGNSMDQSFILAFSTGDVIDNALISGYIEGMENPGATWLWGYPLDSLGNPDPREEKAPFATQPDLNGSFTLSHLPEGEFRIFAVVESRRNRLWDSEREAIAFPSRDCQALENGSMPVNLYMHSVDLIPPSLRSVEMMHRQAGRLSFDEPVQASRSAIFAENETGQKLSVVEMYQNPADSQVVLFTTGIQREGDVYSFHIDALEDLAGNIADSLTADVEAVTMVDTVGPRFTWSNPGNGATDVDWEGAIEIGFSESIITTTIHDAMTMVDYDGDTLTGRWSFPNPNICRFMPLESLSSDEYYTVIINCQIVQDIFGNPSADSLVSFAFTTQDVDATGSFSGRVIDAPPDLRISALNINAPDRKWEEGTSEDGTFVFDHLPASIYRLTLYRDIDLNERYSSGSIDPFTFAEPFEVWSDTIRVRSRWETGDINLHWNRSAGIPDIFQEEID